MSFNNTLQQIPVVAEMPGRKPSMRLHWARKGFQWGVIALAVLIPVSGLFRIDPVDGAFVVLDRQIWFSDFHIVVGFWDMVACGLVMLYSIAGTVFCGWACPQNTFSEWANMMTRKLLGKRAEVMLDGGKMRVSAAKNTWLNWVILGLLFTGVSMAAALIPMFYFYAPDVVWSFVTFQNDERLAGSLHWIYTVFVLIILLDIAFIRHFMCRFMCIYKVWQHTFKTKETLHVAYDSERSDQCAKCNYCVTSCFLDIDPRQTDVYDACTNCGECITACNNLQAKKNGAPGLLRFAIGERNRDNIANSRTGLAGLKGRLAWTLPFMALGMFLFVWGLATYETYHFTVYKSDVDQGTQIDDYTINIAHKKYHPGEVSITLEGLDSEVYSLSRSTVKFDSTGRQDVQLNVKSDQLEPGLVPFIVRIESGDGWVDHFRVHHFVGKQHS